ncbi:intraflagellar transport protein 43 homolog isoform X1 [Bombus impatiens]|uniref:Intraflagellar transport protein 43 homolog isoform X1 n=1 Tax=Bombus impatiens TaxID=132113 RepID=A0A6P6F6W4_BOMIM|nr:intraflagellar transport protein 43 homolog isoform X1 [Bombus impatiens]
MDWAADLEITSKKLLPRLGRRSTQNIVQEDSKLDDDLLESPVSSSSVKSAQPPVAPPRTRKTGWGDELKSGKIRGSSSIIEQLFLRERSRGTEKDDVIDDIPVIPDLDEIQEDNTLSDLVNAPTSKVNILYQAAILEDMRQRVYTIKPWKTGDGKLVYKDQTKFLETVLTEPYNSLHQSVTLFVLQYTVFCILTCKYIT